MLRFGSVSSFSWPVFWVSRGTLFWFVLVVSFRLWVPVSRAVRLFVFTCCFCFFFCFFLWFVLVLFLCVFCFVLFGCFLVWFFLGGCCCFWPVLRGLLGFLVCLLLVFGVVLVWGVYVFVVVCVGVVWIFYWALLFVVLVVFGVAV